MSMATRTFGAKQFHALQQIGELREPRPLNAMIRVARMTTNRRIGRKAWSCPPATRPAAKNGRFRHASVRTLKLIARRAFSTAKRTPFAKIQPTATTTSASAKRGRKAAILMQELTCGLRETCQCFA